MDTAGELIEFVNCFINKKICNLAHKVKFLVAFTSAQMNECRGQPIVDQIEIILNLCSQNFVEVGKSI